MDMQGVAAVSYRGAAIENRHLAHIAVVDAGGRLLYGFGDPERVTLARSAAKPAQAAAIVETGALEHFGFDEADLALMCASHSSEQRHIERTRNMLARLHADESALRCGPHPSLSDAVQRDWIRHDFVPTPACSNCSGKHVGMLAGAMLLGGDAADYHEAGHPMQQRVRRTVAALCELPPEQVLWGIDGCNLPTPAFALDRLARLYAGLADAADAADAAPGSTSGSTLARIYHAMTRHPELVAGEGRYCTELMRAYEGALVGKLGADGCYGIGVRASARTRELGADGALGLAVKIEDGRVDMLYMIVSEVLARLGLGSQAQRERLAAFHEPPLRNTRGVEVGHRSFPFELRPA
ncbi:asparaginase [Thiomonas sp. FB-6]|uniref:asparaginase n=1 Tax=Thiomonas sp. FB-6 TaxID=1158291 RepID=UPI00047595B2|nr:asparaginase [Thiomonas sp. FB-6]